MQRKSWILVGRGSFRLVASGVCTAMVLSCVTVPSTVQDIGWRLDAVGRALDEFGTASVSSPLLADVRTMDRSFAFDLKATPDTYYKIAREDVHGGLSVFSQRAADVRAGFQARANLEDMLKNAILLDRFYDDERTYRRRNASQDAAVLLKLLLPMIDPALAVATDPNAVVTTDPNVPDVTDPNAPDDPAKRKLDSEQERVARIKAMIEALGSARSGLSGATSRPVLPEFSHSLPSFDPNLVPDNKLATLLFEEQKFRKFQGLLDRFATTQPAVLNRSALITAAGDSMVEAIMSFLGYPIANCDRRITDFKDKVVLMGVSMVSVAPGKHTQRGYVADVAVTCRLRYRPARIELVEALNDNRDSYFLDLTTAILERTSDPGWEALRKTRVALEIARSQGQSDRVAALEKKEASQLREVMREEARALEALTRDQVTADGIAILDNVYELQQGPEGPFLLEQGKYLSYPVVSAASPMTEAQTLDLASSIRTQQAFALKLAVILSGFGAEAEAQGLFKSIDRLEQDAKTRTPLNTVAAYSNAGSTFGYQIGPSLQGVADFIPTQRVGGLINVLGALIAGELRPGPDMVLQRQSFPVMLFIGLNRYDLRLKVMVTNDNRFYFVEPVLEFQQTTRWIPMKPSRADLFQTAPPTITESQRVAWAWNLAKADSLASDTDHGLEGVELRQFRDYVNARTATLQSQALVATSYQTLPFDLIAKPSYDESPPPAECSTDSSEGNN